MGFTDWWSRCRDGIHGMEPEYNLASRLAHTPPEFWSPSDNSDARRLIHRRKTLHQKFRNKGYSHEQSIFLVNKQLPEGPFWPQIPQQSNELRKHWVKDRMQGVVAQKLGLIHDPESIAFIPAPDGETFAVNPHTGEAIPMAHFGM